MNSIPHSFASTDTNNIDTLIHDLGGCGRYQLFVSSFVMWLKLMSAISMMMMAYGNYNPGWQCLDNSTTLIDPNRTAVTGLAPNSTLTDDEKCTLYYKCQNVQFDPEVSTIVSEWHLLCDRAWISNLIISLQMAGVLIGAYLSGYLGDKFGRKSTMYAFMVFHVITNAIAVFSTSWQMFAVMRFLIGIAIPSIMYLPVILLLEFVPFKWRNAIIVCPIWPLGCVLFTLCAMITEDWRSLHAITAIGSFISLIPYFWMPESLRWLVVKDKMKNACSVVKNIADMNKSKYQGTGALQRIANTYRGQTQSDDHSLIHLLKKGLRKPTIIIGITCISFSMIYYAISFSVKSLPGNFYINLLIMFSSELPMVLVSGTVPNYTGRKIGIIIFLAMTTTCLFSIVVFDLKAGGNFRDVGILVSAMLARGTVDAAWDVTNTYIGELYPTVIRSTAIAYSSWVARIGGIMAPHLIPNDAELFFLSYLIMGVLSLICCGLLFFLPETRGKVLHDTWSITVPEPILNGKTVEEGEEKVEKNGNCV